MGDRQLHVQSRLADLILPTRPNWTAVWFFALLSLLHWSIAIPAFIHGRWEGYLSLFFGVIFIGMAWACWRARHEVAVLQGRRCIRLRTGFRRLCMERFIPFDHVRGVRLMLGRIGKPIESRVELLCDYEDIECPPTTIPRQQALCLAVAIGVELIKVNNDETSATLGRIGEL